MSRRSFLGGLGAVGGVLSLPGLARAIQDVSSPYRRPKLKITDVRTAQVLAHGPQVHVRIYTDQGLVGQGEATDAAVGAPPLINGPFKRVLVGQDPLNVDNLFERIRTLGIFAGAQAGQYVTALSGVEIALWDLAGKALGLPVYQLLGGKMRDKVRVYCDSQTESPTDPQAKEKLAGIRDMGFTALKIDIDDRNDPNRWDAVNWTASNAEIDTMIGKIAFVRESFPKRVDLAVDMARALRHDDGQARGEGGRAVQAAVPRGARPARERGRHAGHPRVHLDADLLRREPLPAARLQGTA